MSINNIILSDITIAEWYRESTLIPSSNPSALAQPPTPQSQPASPQLAQPATAQPPSPQPAATALHPAHPQSQPTTPPDYKFLGNNRRRVSILVDSPGTAFVPDDQLNFLSKILEACRMNIGDVAIINHHTTPIVINTLRQQLQPQHIILFGVEPTAIRLPINFPEFKLQPYDQCTYLSAPPLKDLVPNTADAKLLKSKLWVCLKTLFEV